MLRFTLVVFLTSLMFTAFGQDQITGKLRLIADFSNLKELPIKISIERSDLGNYKKISDTIKITGKTPLYETQLAEPEFLKIVFYWQGRNLTSTSFWAIASTYQLNIGNDLKPTVINSDESDFAIKVNILNKEVENYRNRADSLVKNVSYENQKIEDVENRMYFIRDSIDNFIDENLYKKLILSHLNSLEGLYALCKYAERPFVNQRIKSQPEKIALLLNSLNAKIRQMPSAQILSSKLALGQQMAIGKVLKDISLPDTAGKVFKISDFKGKYVLVDFWASWCMPCREENPGLIKAYNKYKDAGFQIIGITRDEKSLRNNWLQAIEKDHINIWPQLSDFDNLAQKASKLPDRS